MSVDTQEDLQNRESQAAGAHSPNPARNPSQQHYDDEFNRLTGTPDMQALNDQGDAAARDYNPDNTDQSRRALTGRENDADQQRKTALGDTGLSSDSSGPQSGFNRLQNTASKLFLKIKSPKGAAIAVILSLATSMLVGMGFLAPSSLLMHLNENGKSWMSKYTNLGVNNRLRQQLATRIFEDPGKCSTKLKAVKRYCGGLTTKELSRLRENPHFIIDEKKVHYLPDKTVWLDEIQFKDGDVTHTVDVKNFAKMHAKNAKFQTEFNSLHRAQSLSFRAKNSLLKFSKRAVDRAKPLGDATDEKGLLKYFREKFYKEKGSLNVKPASSAEEDDPLNKLDEFDKLDEQADSLRGADVVENGPGSLVPDTEAFSSPKSLVSTIKSAGTSGLKGVVLGVFQAVDSACSVYNTIRILNFGVKAFTALHLIKFAMTYSTIADKQKASATAMAEASFLATSLLRKSTMPASLGKDFSQSQGANLLFYGKITNPKDLARFSLGSTAMAALGALFSVLNFKGIAPGACKNVSSWWAQILMIVGGIIFSALSLGVNAIAGGGLALAKALTVAYIQQIITPKLIPIIAGTVVPDITKDPEGGYGIGNAIAAGLGAFGADLGRSKGFRVLTNNQFAALSTSEDARMLARVEQYEYNKRGLWSLDNPNSLPNTLALQFIDLTTPKSSLSEYVASMSGSTTRAIAKVSQTAGAASPGQERGQEFCGDKQTRVAMKNDFESDLAQDANCNYIHGPNPAIIASDDPNDPNNKYSPKNVAEYMVKNNHIEDDETGTPKSDEYKNFLEACVEGTDPLIDKYGADLQDGLDMTPCYEKEAPDEMYNYFSAFVADSDTRDGIVAGANGTLGSSGGSTTTTDDPQTGDVKSLAQQILDLAAAGKITITSASAGADLDSDIASRSTPQLQLEDMAAGKPVGITTRCSFTVPSPITPDPKILQFLVDLGKVYHYTITSLFGQCHSSAGSNHYKGKAVDFGCPFNTSPFADTIGKKYGVSHNFETCGTSNHTHYSVGGS